MTEEDFKAKAPSFLLHTGKWVKIKFTTNTNKIKELMHFKTLKIDLKAFLPDLIGACKSLGVKFHQYSL